MKQGIDTTVILAAGLGSRLGDLKENQPKAFVKVGGVTLIERSLQLLISRGVTSIIIGTGYKHEYFDDLRKQFPQVITLKNPDFDKTGSMYTLYLLRSLVKKPFLLLEGDLLYEPAALDLLLQESRDDVILASETTLSGDEVFIQSDDNSLLVGMSKKKGELSRIDGELVGICKLTPNTLSAMCHFADEQYINNRRETHYEDALVGVAKTIPLYIKVARDLAWCEIDDASHLDRATSIVYPKILQRTK